MFSDERVVELWDEQRVAGTWVGRHLERVGAGDRATDVFWDGFLVFNRAARWASVPSGLVGAGASAIAATEELEDALAPLL